MNGLDTIQDFAKLDKGQPTTFEPTWVGLRRNVCRAFAVDKPRKIQTTTGLAAVDVGQIVVQDEQGNVSVYSDVNALSIDFTVIAGVGALPPAPAPVQPVDNTPPPPPAAPAVLTPAAAPFSSGS